VRQGRGAALPRKRDTDLLSETPIVARLMEIGMADATIEDFHDDVVWAQRAPLKGERFKWRRGGLSRISKCFHI